MEDKTFRRPRQDPPGNQRADHRFRVGVREPGLPGDLPRRYRRRREQDRDDDRLLPPRESPPSQEGQEKVPRSDSAPGGLYRGRSAQHVVLFSPSGLNGTTVFSASVNCDGSWGETADDSFRAMASQIVRQVVVTRIDLGSQERPVLPDRLPSHLRLETRFDQFAERLAGPLAGFIEGLVEPPLQHELAKHLRTVLLSVAS